VKTIGFSLVATLLALCAAPPVTGENAGAVKVLGNFEVQTVKDVAYRDGKDADPVKHKLDLYLPKGHRDFPVLFFVHGGSWRSGDKKIYGPLGQLFARNGIGVVVTNYRLSPKVTHPAHIEDVARAFAWTHANVGKHGGKAEKLFVCGHSAGGHLAALLATDESYLKTEKLSLAAIKGVLALSGVYLIAPGFFPAQFGKDEEVCRKASPLSHVAAGKHAPFFIAYADKDMPLLGPLAERMGRELRKAKCAVEVLQVKERDHISIIRKMAGGEADPLAQAMLAFLAKHAGLELKARAAAKEK
jgi:acetyl esterase/lipase